MTRRALVVLIGSCAIALSSARAQTLPPIRSISTPIARAVDSLGSVSAVVALSNGHVLVNDITRRRLLMFDAELRNPVVVMDNTGSTTRAYGQTLGTLLSYRMDSSVFVDRTAGALVVIAPDGSMARVMALPPGKRPTDSFSADFAFDSLGRAVYVMPQSAPCDSVFRPDSSVVVRADLRTGHVDTVAHAAIDSRVCTRVTSADGLTVTSTQIRTLFFPIDGWAVMSDGSIGIVRGHAYRVDWVGPDGTRTSTPPIAHRWIHLDDSTKAAVVDSAHRVLASRAAAGTTTVNGVTRRIVVDVSDAASTPDYRLAFTDGVVADLDDDLWIPSGDGAAITAAATPPTQFDIVNRTGALVDRVQLPGGTRIAGFGRNIVYLTSREGAGASLIAVRIR